jgi:leucyl-tRNA synthetase
MSKFRETEKKWIKRWQEARIFEATPVKGKKKFFGTFPYPYVNSYLHIGHFYSSMRLEALARYKRMQGYNILYAQGWHCTGSPIVSTAKRIADKEPKQVEILRKQGFSDKEIERFADPLEWIKYFPKEAKKDFTEMGYSIDFRREFITTSLNPHYDRFIRWQFSKLKELNYVIKGKFPVVWDPVGNAPVGDHDRIEGEGETPKDFIWAKFRLKDSDLILMAGTTRPDALYGQSNLWLDPHATYSIVKVDNEKWVVGEKAVQKIEDQYKKPEVIGKIKSTELLGKWVKGPLVDYDLYILPAEFIDAGVGSGIVYSALEDPVDLYELHKLQTNPELRKKYHLDEKIVQKLKPIEIINVPGMGSNLGEEIGKEFGVKSAEDKDKLEEAKGELNRRVFRKGIMRPNCGKCAGMTVPEAQEILKKDLTKSNEAVMFYELTGKVVARTLGECIVKIVDDQWFIAYGNEEWKKKAHECLDSMRLYPEKTRSQFNYVLDWLRNWACTREFGLGTKLPWDEKWLIESLSDSTIYMAYYTISHKIKEIPAENLDNNFFDYVFLGKGDAKHLKVEKKLADELHEEFEYWYPMDFRVTGKDLIQNHMSFCIFNHTAIFPKRHWPKSFGLNGWVTVDGEKMAKSKGNFIIIRDANEEYGADASRITALSGGEGIDDANFDREMAKTMGGKLSAWLDFAKENYNKGRKEKLEIDEWFEGKIDSIITATTGYYEETLFRSALQSSYFEMQNALKWYMRRTMNNPNKDTINKYIETLALLMTPITPFICEEIWEAIGKKGFITEAQWPKAEARKSTENTEEIIQKTMEDVYSVLKLLNLEKPKEIKLFVAEKWKYELYDLLGKEMKETRDFGKLMASVMKHDHLKQHSKDITKIIQKLMKTGVDKLIPREKELSALKESAEFLSSEFNAKVHVLEAEESKEEKARNAMPNKPAILVA